MKKLEMVSVVLVAAVISVQDASAKEVNAWTMDFGGGETVPVGTAGDLKNTQTDRCLVPVEDMRDLRQRGQDVQGRARGLVKDHRDRASNLVKDTRNGVSNLAKDTRGGLSGLAKNPFNSASNLVKNTRDGVSNLGKSTRDGVSNLVKETRDSVSGAAKDARDSVSGLAKDALGSVANLMQTDWDLGRCGGKQVKILRQDTSAPGPLVCGEAFALQLGDECYSKCTSTQHAAGIDICSEACGKEVQYQWQLRGCEAGRPVNPKTPVVLWNTARQDSLVYGWRASKLADTCWADKEFGGKCTTLRDQ